MFQQFLTEHQISSHRWTHMLINSFLFMTILTPQSSLNYLRDLMFRQNLCMRCDAWADTLSCTAAAFWIFRIDSMEECSSLMHNWMHICCSTHSVILNAKATQYTCSLNGVYCPHWLVQWSHFSRMHILVHSPWLPGYTDVTQIVPVIIIMVGFLLDRPCTLTCSVGWEGPEVMTPSSNKPSPH